MPCHHTLRFKRNLKCILKYFNCRFDYFGRSEKRKFFNKLIEVLKKDT